MEKCPSCGGTGKCKWCEGSGKDSSGEDCKKCYGSGKCSDKTPSGYRCHGTGEVAKI
ncbi:MAG: hypothetical protein U9R27_08815 [Campylobacterota bacterium]|nr:hypothetical protein [Campylobacterota bacterium]